MAYLYVLGTPKDEGEFTANYLLLGKKLSKEQLKKHKGLHEMVIEIKLPETVKKDETLVMKVKKAVPIIFPPSEKSWGCDGDC